LSLIRGGRMAGGSERKTILVGLVLALVLGIGVYLRLWTIDYTLSSDDTERLRRQFDLANREAMDESADWRRMFDKEAEKASKCNTELSLVFTKPNCFSCFRDYFQCTCLHTEQDCH
jgi:hypothetical protein